MAAVLNALATAFDMLWEVFWPLALGFILSAIVQTLVSRQAVVRALGSDSPRSLGLATLFGAASSSCSYAAVAISRSLFRKGASFPAAIVFEFASTNLVFELGLILLILLGWSFVGAEFAGGLLMIVILALLFRWTLKPGMIDEARRQAEHGRHGRMEGHGEMDMAITEGPFVKRLFSGRGLTAISHNFWMDVTSVWIDIGIGLLIAGALAAWVPASFWQSFFLTGHPVLSQVWGPLIGPVISLLSFVCSVGNVPLAAVLWNGGISFGGVIAFVFADLIILPILDIYRKYYGGRMALYLLVVSYAAMALAGFTIGLLFQGLGIVPAHRSVAALVSNPTLNYTSVLNGIFLVIIAILGWRFLRTGGLEMLRMMERPMPDHAAHQH
ncbi:MAG: permease [Chloroflexi bacterium]|nr:MAG: permease [Chloroflexota bacterium]TMD67847.1 MAG: permease [Chloroflexota bacterium]